MGLYRYTCIVPVPFFLSSSIQIVHFCSNCVREWEKRINKSVARVLLEDRLYAWKIKKQKKKKTKQKSKQCPGFLHKFSNVHKLRSVPEIWVEESANTRSYARTLHSWYFIIARAMIFENISPPRWKHFAKYNISTEFRTFGIFSIGHRIEILRSVARSSGE